MIADLKPYGEYSPSEIRWIDRTPSHWLARRGKTLFTKKDRPVRPEDEVITCFRDGVVTLRRNRRTTGFTNAILEIGYQGIRKGDLVIHGMDAFAGATGVADSDGKGTPVYSVCEPHENANPYFFAHVVREMARNNWIVALSRGIRERSTDFRFEMFGRQFLPLPPKDEQELIVHFLDWASLRLEKAIRAKRRVIALLEEQKQAIIHRAVTRGLDDTVPLKPSGLDWLGDIPAGWDVKRAGALFAERKENGIKGLPLLVVSLNTGITVSEGLDHRGREKRLIADVEKYSLTRKGDIAYNMMRMWQGAVGVVPTDGMVSPAYVVARPRTSSTNTSYYELFFRTDACKGEVNRQSTGIVSDRNRLYWESFKQLKLPVPPETEQQDIVDGVREKLEPLERTKASLNREIELIREYRTRLISDVVTGKLDVRDVARSLPELERSESIDAQPADADLDDFADDEPETEFAEGVL